MTRRLTTLEGLPGTSPARRLPVRVEVRFAAEDGVCHTREGEVSYRMGDALVEGGPGDRWPVRRETFRQRFRAEPGTQPMQDGAYTRTIETVRVLQLTEAASVELSEGRGVLAGQPGDWVVERAPGRVSIVAGDVFPARFEIIDDV